MKILFAGNSQATCIKQAFDANPDLLKEFDVSFYVVPGGTGPYLTIARGGALRVTMQDPKFPARVHPASARDVSISDYDAIIVGGLGFYDGGFYYPNIKILRHCFLQQYEPKPNEYAVAPVSRTLSREIMATELSKQPGFAFLRILRSHFSGTILVHPFPVPSELVKEHPDWPLNKMYGNPLGAHAFFLNLRDGFLEQECRANDAILLPYPQPDWRERLFAPKEGMNKAPDGLHPDVPYGVLICQQVVEALGRVGRS